MSQLKQQVTEIFAKYDGGNSLIISEMHRCLNEKNFAEAKKLMKEELRISEDDSKVLISYYKKRVDAKAKFVEILVNEVVCADPDDPIGSEEYLFIYGQGVFQSAAYENHRKGTLEFYAERNTHDISKARQIFRIEWDF